MSTKTKSKPKKSQNSRFSSSIVWFEIPADNPERAKKFYGKLFNWKINKFPGMTDYWHIDTGGGDQTPDGGMIVRKHPQQPITNYILVPSVEKSAAQVEKRQTPSQLTLEIGDIDSLLGRDNRRIVECGFEQRITLVRGKP